MTAPVESLVAVPPNVPGGTNIRQVQLQILQPSGTIATVLVEAVSITDASTGIPLDLEQQDWRDEMLRLNRIQAACLVALCGAQDIDVDLQEAALQSAEEG